MPSSRSPDRSLRITAASRALGRRHHWRLAAALAPGITTLTLRGWFQEFFMESQRLPANPKRRILWLVEVRSGFRDRRDSLAVLMVSAAIYREAMRIRRVKRLAHRLRKTGRQHMGSPAPAHMAPPEKAPKKVAGHSQNAAVMRHRDRHR